VKKHTDHHQALLGRYQQRFKTFALTHLPQDDNHVGAVFKAIHYSFFAAGKRLRPALVYALAESLSIPLARVDVIALAVECIHTYSLIHDDLPAMDDDNTRRGQPACHRQFDEGTAILAGDALNTLAFELLSATSVNTQPHQQIQQICCLAKCAGISGMIAGQDTDLTYENTSNPISLAELSMLHQKKTAKLIEACFIITYLAQKNSDEKKLKQLSQAALSLGLYYQIQDDILDLTQSSDILGKPSSSDAKRGKATFVSVLGLEKARQIARQIARQTIVALNDFFAPNSNYRQTPLAVIVAAIMDREH